MRTAAFLACLLLTVSRQAGAVNSRTATSTMQFLRIGSGARPLGMGEAFGPVAEGPHAIHFNPAGLAQTSRPELAYTHVEMLRFYHFDHLAYVHPVRFLGGALGASLTFFYEDSQDLVTNTNQKIGSFSNHSEAYTLAYGRGARIGEDWGMSDRRHFDDLWRIGGAEMPLRPEDEVWNGSLLFGAAMKLAKSTLHDRSAAGLMFDGGVLFRHTYFPKLAMSAAFRNLGRNVQFIHESERLPSELAFGLAFDQRWDRHRLLPAVELLLPYSGEPSANVGVEYVFPVHYDADAAVRAGYRALQGRDVDPIAGITGGIGLGYRGAALNLAFQPMAELGDALRIELNYRF